MLDDEKRALSLYRVDKAKECIKSAEILYESGHFTDAANRAYYAIFHSARAVLAIDGVDRKKHSGVIAYFQQNYIKTGVIDKSYSYILQKAFRIRQESDYEDFYIISKEEVKQQMDDAKRFVAVIERYLSEVL